MKECVFRAKDENLDAVLAFIGKELEAADCSAKLKTQIALAVEEVFVNISHYAYYPGEGDVTIRVDADSHAVIEFTDSGKPYNPLEKEDPDITASSEEREIGGLGIFIVKRIMDVTEYNYKEGKNILLTKKAIK